ncbi:MAG: FAD-dependent oxidoreductase [Paracoccus sp. (in: a-proteobacteria)]|nr:FAD-dependent oxidoreductase [Paracoccus sp. (in: a-proteobacteria)]
MTIIAADHSTRFDAHVPLVIIGGGGCGLVAALAAQDAGAEALVLERDPVPRGSTAMSSGFIPAAGTRFQRLAGVGDDPETMAADIQAKNDHEADPAIVQVLSQQAGGVIEWLADQHGLQFSLITGFLYPGHSRMRMHATPQRTGEELMGGLVLAAEKLGIPVVTNARVTELYAGSDGLIRGVGLTRPDGRHETIGCDALLLACSGFGASPELIAQHLPEMQDACYFGHDGNEGDALRWGDALGASLRDLGGYQGHGSLAVPHQILIAWVVTLQGGVQINSEGYRFSNEHGGYSEQARTVLQQPGKMVWNVYDQRIHDLLLAEFRDYRDALAAGAVRRFATLGEMADDLSLPLDALESVFAAMARHAVDGTRDEFGRSFSDETLLKAPFYAVRVTGALFHTQGGLEIDVTGRVLRPNGSAFPNLFAAGGAARGISGAGGKGYSAGNGLLSAVVMGAIAGRSAARLVAD